MPTTEGPRAALYDVHATAELSEYLRALWDRRHYIRFVAVNEVRSRQVNTVLGNFWHMLNPLLQMGVYFLVFGVLIGVDRGIDNFITYLGVSIFVFSFVQRSTIAGANSIVNNRGLLLALPFPRAMLPITSTVTETLATIGPVSVIYIIALLTGETPALRWLLLPVIMSIQVLLNLGSALIAARLTSIVRDTTQVLPLFFRLLFYCSGIIFNPAAFLDEDDRLLRWLFDLNPVFAVCSLARWTILGDELKLIHVVVFLGWSVGLVSIGLLWFRRGEDTYGRD